MKEVADEAVAVVAAPAANNNTETSKYVKNTGKNKKQKVEVAKSSKKEKTVKPMSEKKKARLEKIVDKKKYFKVKPTGAKKKPPAKAKKAFKKKTNKKK